MLRRIANRIAGILRPSSVQKEQNFDCQTVGREYRSSMGAARGNLERFDAYFRSKEDAVAMRFFAAYLSRKREAEQALQALPPAHRACAEIGKCVVRQATEAVGAAVEVESADTRVLAMAAVAVHAS